MVIRATVVTAVAGFGFAACAPGVLASAAAADVLARPSISDIPSVTLTTPRLTISKNALDFGNVPTRTTKHLEIELTNTGNDIQSMSLLDQQITSTAYTFSAADCSRSSFPRGQTCVVIYRFTPGVVGVDNASSSFTLLYSTGGAAKVDIFEVKLTGCGDGPGSGCSPTATLTPTLTPTPHVTQPGGHSGNGTGQGNPPTNGTPLANPLPAASAQNTGSVLAASGNASAGGGLGFAQVLAISALAAILGAAAVLLVWRGRWLWSKLTSRG
jgi:hypothetical protein